MQGEIPVLNKDKAWENDLFTLWLFNIAMEKHNFK
jgi:hypothetical protein